MTIESKISTHEVKLEYEEKEELYSQRLTITSSIEVHPFWLSETSSNIEEKWGGTGSMQFTGQTIWFEEHPTPSNGNGY